jgi:hypothetical protein
MRGATLDPPKVAPSFSYAGAFFLHTRMISRPVLQLSAIRPVEPRRPEAERSP